MFENRSEKQLIIIYVFIALIITFVLSFIHISSPNPYVSDPIYVIIAANVEFFVIFYILYLPLKFKRGQK
jgi:hypothetical protein